LSDRSSAARLLQQRLPEQNLPGVVSNDRASLPQPLLAPHAARTLARHQPARTRYRPLYTSRLRPGEAEEIQSLPQQRQEPQTDLPQQPGSALSPGQQHHLCNYPSLPSNRRSIKTVWLRPVPQEIPNETSSKGTHTDPQWRDAFLLPSLSQEVQPKLHIKKSHEAPLCWKPPGQVPARGEPLSMNCLQC